MRQRQRAKTSRTGYRAIQLAGSAAKGSLDLDLVFLLLRRNGLPLSKLSRSRLTKTGCTRPPRRLQNIGDKNASDTNARHLRNLSFD